MRRLRLLFLILALAPLGGCVVAPAPGYYAPPAASVSVAPRPYGYGYYRRPHYGYGPYWRRW
jgi:hypothetical protein